MTIVRGRVGLGYRFDAQHRIDLLYILDKSQNTIDESPHEVTQALDLRYRMVF